MQLLNRIFWPHLVFSFIFLMLINLANAEDVVCSDTDKGNNPFKVGTVTLFNSNYTDFCYGSGNNFVWEYSCDNKNLYSKGISCNYGCNNGACLPAPNGVKCSDSDSGVDFYEAGSVNFKNKTFSDYCISNTKLEEYSCYKDQLHSQQLDCPSRKACVNGACASIYTCTDTDAGPNQYIKGTTTSVFGTYTDFCYGKNNKQVWEYSCAGNNKLICEDPALSTEQNNKISFYGIGCDFGCQNGACLPYPSSALCSDTDYGYDYYTTGQVTYKNQTYTDICTSSSTIREYLCLKDTLYSADISCPDGKVCQEGSCV